VDGVNSFKFCTVFVENNSFNFLVTCSCFLINGMIFCLFQSELI
jgi:hypothetical protein